MGMGSRARLLDMGAVAMSFGCLFRQCKWNHLFNVKDDENNFGVYQCWQCKTISLGSSRELIHPKSIREALDDLHQMDHEDSKP